MPFQRILSFLGLRSELQEKLEDIGLDKEAAHKSAFEMSATEIDQICVDLARTHNITVVNEDTGFSSKLENTANFADLRETATFIKMLSQDNDEIDAYLRAYMHQGGFLHAAEMLISYFFRTELNDEDKILLNAEGRHTKFTLYKDGSLGFEESFKIDEIKTAVGDHYKSEDGPIATVKLRSRIRVNEGKIEHTFNDVEVNTHDKAAKKLFNDPRGIFAKFIDWVKDVVQSIFDKATREHNQQVRNIPNPRKRL